MADVQGLIRSPKFQALPFEDRRQLLMEASESFKNADTPAQVQIMNEMKQQDWWQGGASKRKPVQPPQRVSPIDKIISTVAGKDVLDYVKNPPTSGNIISNLPRSAANTLYGLANMVGAPYEGLSQGAFENSFPGGNPTPEQQTELKRQDVGMAKTLAAPVGLAGLSAMNEAWATSPVQSALMTLPVVKGVKAGKVAISERMNQPLPESKINNIITQGIEKGIRPGIENNRTFKQNASYKERAATAVKKIVENKDNLQITNEYGEPTGTLPTNLRQFTQAIDQTKGNIFNQYNSMAKAAGESGAFVDLKPLSNELQKVANNGVLQDASPSTVKYAKERAASFLKRGQYTAEQAQEAIAIMNQSLDAYYKNPSYDSASKAYIDALIANHLREGLDASIEKLQGPGYQQLKNEYGALKSIEKDVNRRAIVDARRNNKGLIDFSDVFSGAEVARGLMTMNPAVVGQGIAAKAIAALYKAKNDPNRIVNKMFSKVDKKYQRPEQPPEPPAPPEILGPPHNPNNFGYGKINTVDLPIGEDSRFDSTIGAKIPTKNQPSVMKLSDLIQSDPYYYDKYVGAKIPRKQ